MGWVWRIRASDTEFPGHVTERRWSVLRSIVQQVGDGGFFEVPLEHGDGVIEPLVQRAKPLGMRLEAERTFMDSLQRINRLKHVVDRELVEGPAQDVATTQTSTSLNQTGPPQRL